VRDVNQLRQVSAENSRVHDLEKGYAQVMLDSTLPPKSGDARWFATTHWSVVMAAKQGDSSEATVALDKLCRTYWPPLYAYIRRDGCDAIEAQDLTQAFFARLLEQDFLGRLQDQRGKFRSFLLTFLKHFLSEQRRKASARKRGGGCVFVSMDAPARRRLRRSCGTSAIC